VTAPIAFDDADGLQYERTSLAWLRTALATVAVGLFMFRQTEAGTQRWLVGVATALALIGVLATMRERTAMLHRRPSVVAPARASVPIVLASLVVLDAAGLLLAF
jgi:uncharacterized membrane protein YidH (DUF202 family)